MKQKSKNFGLSVEEFDQLRSRMLEGDESLFESVFLSHFESNVQYLTKNLKRPPEVCYDVCMDAMLLFRKKIIENKIVYGNLNFLFNQMSKQIFIQKLRKVDKVDRATDFFYKNNFENEDKEVLLELMDKTWDELSEECKTILRLFYYENIKLKDLAGIIKKTEVAIRKQKGRCLAYMKSYMKKWL